MSILWDANRFLNKLEEKKWEKIKKEVIALRILNFVHHFVCIGSNHMDYS